MAVFGHASLAQVLEYIEDAEQARMARRGNAQVDKTDQPVANESG